MYILCVKQIRGGRSDSMGGGQGVVAVARWGMVVVLTVGGAAGRWREARGVGVCLEVD